MHTSAGEKPAQKLCGQVCDGTMPFKQVFLRGKEESKEEGGLASQVIQTSLYFPGKVQSSKEGSTELFQHTPKDIKNYNKSS